jgi:transposase InsO family protein
LRGVAETRDSDFCLDSAESRVQSGFTPTSAGRGRLNEHWFTSLAHAQVVIETWRREYNDERPKKGLGGLTPAAFALQLTGQTKAAKVTAGL